MGAGGEALLLVPGVEEGKGVFGSRAALAAVTAPPVGVAPGALGEEQGAVAEGAAEEAGRKLGGAEEAAQRALLCILAQLRAGVRGWAAGQWEERLVTELHL